MLRERNEAEFGVQWTAVALSHWSCQRWKNGAINVQIWYDAGRNLKIVFKRSLDGRNCEAVKVDVFKALVIDSFRRAFPNPEWLETFDGNFHIYDKLFRSNSIEDFCVLAPFDAYIIKNLSPKILVRIFPDFDGEEREHIPFGGEHYDVIELGKRFNSALDISRKDSISLAENHEMSGKVEEAIETRAKAFGKGTENGKIRIIETVSGPKLKFKVRWRPLQVCSNAVEGAKAEAPSLSGGGKFQSGMVLKL